MVNKKGRGNERENNMERKYRTITLADGEKDLVVDFSDSYYELLSVFLVVDFSNFSDWFYQGVQDVLSGKEETLDISGNVCELIIERDKITIYDMLAEDGMGNWCEVATNEMIELMDEWIAEKKKI